MKRFSLTFLIMSLLLTLGTSFVIAGGGPIAHWTLDEGTGKTAKDISGNGYDGELVGDAKWVDGHFDKALEFNGVNNEFVVPDADDLDGMSEMTITAWANPFDKGDSVYPRILSKGHEHSWTFLIDVNAGNKLRFIVSFDGGTKIDITDPADLTSMFNQYHHYTVVWDGKEVVFYIDGKESHRAAAAGGPGINTDQPVRIGNSPSGRHFRGVIDDVWLFNKVLNADDIIQIMEGSYVAVEPAGKLAATWNRIKIDFE